MTCPRCHGMLVDDDDYESDVSLILRQVRCISCGYRMDVGRPALKWSVRIKEPMT